MKTLLEWNLQFIGIGPQIAPGAGINDRYRSAFPAFSDYPELIFVYRFPFRICKFFLAKHPPQKKPDQSAITVSRISAIAHLWNGGENVPELIWGKDHRSCSVFHLISS